jgi:hypothetical protein
VKIFPLERNSFLNLSAPVLNFSGDEGKIFTFKPAQKKCRISDKNKNMQTLFFHFSLGLGAV